MKNRSSFSFRRTAQALFLAMLVIPYFSACKDEKSDLKEMTNLKVRAGTTDFTPVLQSDGKTWSFEVPYGFSHEHLASATVTFSISKGATASPASGDQVDLNSPVNITVTAEDKSTVIYSVTHTVAPSNEAAFTSFKLNAGGEEFTGVIDNANRKVTFPNPFRAPLEEALKTAVPSFELTAGATANPGNGVARDFSSSIAYAITAQDNTTTQIWTVEIVIALPQMLTEMPGLVGLWEFSDPNNLEKATIGKNLVTYNNATNNTIGEPSTAGIRAISGFNSSDGAVEKDARYLFKCEHGIPETVAGTGLVSAYTVVFDLKIPAATTGTDYQTIFKLDLTNTGNTDGIMMRVNATSTCWQTNPGGGPAADDERRNWKRIAEQEVWYRIVVVADNPAYKIFVNGEYSMEYEEEWYSIVGDRRSLDVNGVLFFASNAGANPQMHISTLAIINKAISDDEAKKVSVLGF